MDIKVKLQFQGCTQVFDVDEHLHDRVEGRAIPIEDQFIAIDKNGSVYQYYQEPHTMEHRIEWFHRRASHHVHALLGYMTVQEPQSEEWRSACWRIGDVVVGRKRAVKIADPTFGVFD